MGGGIKRDGEDVSVRVEAPALFTNTKQFAIRAWSTCGLHTRDSCLWRALLSALHLPWALPVPCGSALLPPEVEYFFSCKLFSKTELGEIASPPALQSLTLPTERGPPPLTQGPGRRGSRSAARSAEEERVALEESQRCEASAGSLAPQGGAAHRRTHVSWEARPCHVTPPRAWSLQLQTL